MSNDRNYENGEIVVMWRPDKCIKCGWCHEQMPLVFDPTRRPWIMLSNDVSEKIKQQVEECPSGALTWKDCES